MQNKIDKNNISEVKNLNEKRFVERYEMLNDMQKKAVDNIDGPLLVVAGPGSGKTELLSLRTANILKISQVSPNNILLLTFTDSGAHNMRERLVGLIGESGYKVAVYTFHSFASDIMGRYAEYFFDGASFRPSTDIERMGILENILNEMPRDKKLNSKHPDMGYTYLSDIISCISGLKKGNLSPDEWRDKVSNLEREAESINEVIGEKLLEIKGKRKIEIIMPAYEYIYENLNALSLNIPANNTAKYLVNVLALELKQSIETGKTSNLTEFKKEYFVFEEDTEKFILKDSGKGKIQKWSELADVYEKYNYEMHKKGLYDFDDMIFKVSRELTTNNILRNELEEKYQYIMIDEFQDTNDAQFALVQNLTSNKINEGRPNVMAVGDDDQAIFKFQGAELDNINKFISSFVDVELITLDKNYRSTQNILDVARHLITKVEDRLEVRYAGKINKKIIASNKKLLEKEEGKIIEKSFENIHAEMDYVCSEIKDILSSGVNASEISIISRSHANLKGMIEIMNQHKIPFSYEKKENVFEKQPIKELINMVSFVDSGFDGTNLHLLPEIMTYKFWNLSRLDIWNIAEKAKEGIVSIGDVGEKIYKKASWLTIMSESDNTEIKNIALFLIELISDAKSMPLTHLIDKIIGTNEWEIDGEHDDDHEKNREVNYKSLFRNYYFGKENFDHNKPEYLEFLFALRTFMGALREYRSGEILYAKDLSEFISIYNNNQNLSLKLTSPFATSSEAVVLQTAHKSKGLEYEYVFIINSDEDEWNGRKRTNKIGMPINLKLLPSNDELSDRTRLYYVAMTRAKHTLFITHNNQKFQALFSEEQNQKNKEDKLEAKKQDKLNKENVIEGKIENSNNLSKELVNSLQIKPSQILLQDEKILLKRLLENYKMPVTHLINYLNIGKVGPENFIEQNLLRFPQAMSPSSVYGSAMHAAMQNYYLYFKKYQKLASNEKLIEYFTNALGAGTLTKIDYDKYLESGIKNLNIYIEDLKSRGDGGIRESDMVEVNFVNEGVHIGAAHVSGKIDKMSFDGNTISVTDLKTGKSFSDWGDGSGYDKIKLHFNKYQLAYYYLLIKNSRTYQNYNVDFGYIEFLEADNSAKSKTKTINILELKLDAELIDRVEKLTNIIYLKVINLDFPDTTNYKLSSKTGEEKEEVTLADIIRFEEDLLSSEI